MKLNMLMQITLSRRQMILWRKNYDIFLRNLELRRPENVVGQSGKKHSTRVKYDSKRKKNSPASDADFS